MVPGFYIKARKQIYRKAVTINADARQWFI